jgi:hypothetical protein
MSELDGRRLIALACVGQGLNIRLVVATVQRAHIAAEPAQQCVNFGVGCVKPLVNARMSVMHDVPQSGRVSEPVSRTSWHNSPTTTKRTVRHPNPARASLRIL